MAQTHCLLPVPLPVPVCLPTTLLSLGARCCAAGVCCAALLAGTPATARTGTAASAPSAAATHKAGRHPGPALRERGLASWYGAHLHRQRTASGERFDMHALTAAHPWLPFGARVCVRSLVNGKTVVVRINDRGPHGGRRIIDLSHGAAKVLGLLGRGTKPVELTAWSGAQRACPGA